MGLEHAMDLKNGFSDDVRTYRYIFWILQLKQQS